MFNDSYNNMIADYNHGMSINELHYKYKLSENYIKKLIKDEDEQTYNNLPFSENEIQILKNNYYFCDISCLLTLLPNRDTNSIFRMANEIGFRTQDINLVQQIKNEIADKPFTMVESTFTTLSNGFEAITDEGYKVWVREWNIYTERKPKVFYISNPFTIENIRYYIKKNNIDIELLSQTYLGENEKMLWKCCCGKNFQMTFKQFLKGKHCCNECSKKNGAEKRKTDLDYVYKKLDEIGCKIIYLDESSILSHNKFDIEDADGYRYNFNWNQFLNGSFPRMVSPFNNYSIYNINKYLEISNKSDYKCISSSYNGKFDELEIQHIACGTIFKTSWEFIRKTNDLSCPACCPKKVESNHASILKQVFIHEYPDTIAEERSCINPETGRVLPTDIVNHRLKIAIEVQSGFHDSEERQKRDAIKKDYWKNHGYDFFAPDIRDYSILEMIQLFFANITEIPDYIDYNFSNCADHNIVQQYLDDGYLISEISEITGLKIGAIHGMVESKRVILPKGYSDRAHGIKPVVQLDLNGNLIMKYEKMSDAKKDGHNVPSISSVLHGRLKTHHDSVWVYEEDYLSGNYTIPQKTNIINKS